MDLRDYYTKWSKQTEKNKCHMTSLICGIFRKKWYKQTYLQNRNRLTKTENRIVVAEGQGEREDKLGLWDQKIHSTIYKIDK